MARKERRRRRRPKVQRRFRESHLYDDTTQLANALADRTIQELQAALETRGEASLVISGGSTPVPYFTELRRRELSWHNVWVTLADERWVSPDHADSNERLIREHLLQDQARDARFVPLKNVEPTPEEGVQATEEALVQVPRPFDFVVLGMGLDGHTASLFPHTTELNAALDLDTHRLCIASIPPRAPHARLSLTLAPLCRSRAVVLHVTGEAKRKVLHRASLGGPAKEYPIRAVLDNAGDHLDLYWAP
ncbi:MAG: 6-phosphogluconolactonase [Acidobacteriota bacterium]